MPFLRERSGRWSPVKIVAFSVAAGALDRLPGGIRLGSQRWNSLHRLVYAIALLASVHFFMQSKLNIHEPVLMAGFLAWLLPFRVVFRRQGELTPLHLLFLAGAVAVATAAAEATIFMLTSGINLMFVQSAEVREGFVKFGYSPDVMPAIGLAALIGSLLYLFPKTSTLGAIMLTVIWFRVMKGHFTPQRHFGFEAVAWYWHFVDVVWLGLFTFVYWL